MNFPKHTAEAQIIKKLENEKQELLDVISRRNTEIKDIKVECAEQFRLIRDLCFCNDYNGKLDKLRKIHEVASDNFSALVKDIIIDETDQDKKIIELPNTRKSNK